MDISVVICTYNRTALLARTLDTLAQSRVRNQLRWEVIVVDNNSTDDTRDVVESRAVDFPAPLRWIFEGRQGKSIALNTGIEASAASIIVFTDDDVGIPQGWLEAGIRPLLERTDIEYTGGPVHGMWETPPPQWIQGHRGLLWGPIALVDYGPEPFIFEDRRRIALGVNMAVRRSLIDRVGGFHPDLERKGTSLMGQGQAEFFFRTRAAGAIGLYVPEMMIHHHVPAARLTREYYRRWWRWKGIARARLDSMYPVSELGVDMVSVPRVLGVPRFMWGSAVRDAIGWIGAAALGDTVRLAEREMALAYFAGYFKARREAPARRAGQAVHAASRSGSSVEAGPPASIDRRVDREPASKTITDTA
jgi:glycosyltransferase involved in cell wall biosynthesis